MSDSPTEFNQTIKNEIPYRDVSFGRIYDRLEPHKPINIAAFGAIWLEIDEEKLDLERVGLGNLLKAWERVKETWTRQCQELGITIDPFTVFKYYHIQRKVYEILGRPISDDGMRKKRLGELSNFGEKVVPLSQMKGSCMCAEYAILATYIAQKLGEPVHLISGMVAIDEGDGNYWREPHAFTWIDGINGVFDSVLAQSNNEYPALMLPLQKTSLDTLEAGLDVETRRIGTTTTRIYGLMASSFGIKLAPLTVPTSLQEAAGE